MQTEGLQSAAGDLDLVSLRTALPSNIEIKALSEIVSDAPALEQATNALREGVMIQLAMHCQGRPTRTLRESRERYYSEVLGLGDPDPFLGTDSRIPADARAAMSQTLKIPIATYKRTLEDFEAAYAVLHHAANRGNPNRSGTGAD